MGRRDTSIWCMESDFPAGCTSTRSISSRPSSAACCALAEIDSDTRAWAAMTSNVVRIERARDGSDGVNDGLSPVVVLSVRSFEPTARRRHRRDLLHFDGVLVRRPTRRHGSTGQCVCRCRRGSSYRSPGESVSDSPSMTRDHVARCHMRSHSDSVSRGRPRSRSTSPGYHARNVGWRAWRPGQS